MTPIVPPDPSTSIEVWGAYQAAKRVLGPTADLLGEGLRGLTEKAGENLGRIYRKAEDRLGDDESLEGSVPPRVLKAVIEEGSFCDDDLGQNYFAGVLVSSKTESERDDRGATLTALVGRLSSYEIRTHYLMYAHAQRHLAKGIEFNLGMEHERQAHARIFLPFDLWFTGMGFTSAEGDIIGDVISESMLGLLRESLLEGPYGFGGAGACERVGFAPKEAGLAAQLTPLGVQLFVWAHGYRQNPQARFLDPATSFVMPDMPEITDGAISIDEERHRQRDEQEVRRAEVERRFAQSADAE